MIYALLSVVDIIFKVYIFILIAGAVFSWLYAFNIVNPHNPLIAAIGNFLYQVTEPVLAPIRRILPNLGSIDVSPIVVLLIIYFIHIFMWRAYAGLFF